MKSFGAQFAVVIGVPALSGGFPAIDFQALNTLRSDMLAYWPLTELSGTVAYDLSGNAHNGTYGGASLPNENVFLDNSPCASVNGGHINIYSADFAAAFTPDLYTIAGWVKTTSANWPSGDVIANLYADGSNHIQLSINSVYPLLSCLRRAAGTPQYTNVDGCKSGEWLHVAIGFDLAGNVRKTWLNGALELSLTASNAFVGTIGSTTTVLGALNTLNGNTLTSGLLRGWGIWNAMLSDAQIKNIYDAAGSSVNMFLIGDSKTAGDRWRSLLRTQLIANKVAVYALPAEYATAGWAIANVKTAIDANLSSETDVPENILINIGSNGAETEAAFKADYRYCVEALHAKWPNATIYAARPVVLNAVPPSTPSATNITKRGWIDDVIGEYSYVLAGIDETDLEGGDGYATNLTDITHYTDAGQITVTDLWLAIL